MEFEKQLIETLTEMAKDCSSEEELQEVAEKKYDIPFDEDILIDCIKIAFLKSRARLPCAETFFDNYKGIGPFVWSRRNEPHVREEILEHSVIKECKNCEKPFEFYYTCVGNFCSRNCSIEYHNKHKQETDIERLTREWLENNDVKYQAQYRIDLPDGRWTIVDFMVEPKICIYADEKYWHSSDAAIDKDNFQDEELPKLGYIVVRLYGDDIRAGIMPIKLLDIMDK